jgi:hypothetical protein
MALQCGTSNDGCQGKAGKYRIEYTLVEPSYVRYRYAGEAWQEIKRSNSNLTYRIDRVSQPGKANGVRYRISVYTQANLRISDSRGDRYEGTYYPYYGATNQFVGPISSIVIRRTDSFGGARWNMGLRVVHAGGTTTFALFPYSSPNGGLPIKSGIGASHYWQLPEPPPDYPLMNLQITRIDGQPEAERWRFQVLDAMNNVVFSREEVNQPEAIVVPEAYGSNTGNFVISNSQQNVPLKIVNSEVNNRKSTSVLLGNTVIKKLDSPLGSSFYPRVCWDCEGDRCPENTCSVDCGDRICCYNSLGIAIKEIRK